jgi:hypothetical protein
LKSTRPGHPPPASNPIYVERCPRLERFGRGLFEGEEAVLHVMGVPRWAWASARSLCLAAPHAGGRVGGRSSLAQGIPRAAMSPAASGRRTVVP